jgi:stearoyl-CoA desaturase (delta-9 desaturase)
VQFHALLKQARDALPNVDTMVRMREELRQLWLDTNASRAQLALDLQQWCLRAEQSGVVALRDFSMQLRAARV